MLLSKNSYFIYHITINPSCFYSGTDILNNMENFDINKTALGKQSSTPEKYDPALLFRIPRSENREKYLITESDLPFIGYDIWNCYEVSFLTKNGLPISRILKLIYSAKSKYLVESKSLKLYLSSFNMECFENSIFQSEQKVKSIIEKDLKQLLETEVLIALFDKNSEEKTPFEHLHFPDLISIIPKEDIENISFTHFNESSELLKSEKTDRMYAYFFSTDILRSNCRVTNQPDWGDLYVTIKTHYKINLSSLLAYLVSFRKENHFHEEVVEMIYKRFYDAFECEKLMVAAMYTRRGGIDINPIRTSHEDWLDGAFISTRYRLAKTWRQ